MNVLRSLKGTILAHDMVEICSGQKKRNRQFLMYRMDIGAVTMKFVGRSCYDEVCRRSYPGKKLLRGLHYLGKRRRHRGASVQPYPQCNRILSATTTFGTRQLACSTRPRPSRVGGGEYPPRSRSKTLVGLRRGVWNNSNRSQDGDSFS